MVLAFSNPSPVCTLWHWPGLSTLLSSTGIACGCLQVFLAIRDRRCPRGCGVADVHFSTFESGLDFFGVQSANCPRAAPADPAPPESLAHPPTLRKY